jgi:FK506-binding nuclear protein
MSPVAIALWYVLTSASLVKCSSSRRSLALKPSKEPVSFVPQSDLHITNIALGDELADTSGRTSVKLTYQTPIKLDSDDEDEESPDPISTTVLGSLTPGKVCAKSIDSTCI